MIKTVVSNYNWHPSQLGCLFIDEQDYMGLEYWYNHVIEESEKLKKK